jgi:hypothetical protein
MRRHREVIIEIDEVVIRRASAINPGWCPECGEQVQMLTPDGAALVAGLSLRTIYRQVEAGRLHFSEVPEGPLLICPNSLSK